MRVGLEHIDPKVAAAMRDRLCAPGIQFLKDNIRWADAEESSLIRLFLNQALRRPEQRPPDEAERIAYQVHRQREKMAYQRGGVTFGSAIAGGGLIGMLFYTLTGSNIWVGVVIAILVGSAAFIIGGIWAWQATSYHELYYEVTVAELLAVVPLMTLTDVEAAYCDMLTRVCDHDPNQEARRAVRRHIAKLKELVVIGRQLEGLAAAAAQNQQVALQERVESVQDALIDAIHAITDAICTILVVPSPAGDRASELIEKELQTFHQAVTDLAADVPPLEPVSRKRGRVKVS